MKIMIAYEAQTTKDPPLPVALIQVFIERLQTSAMLSSRHALHYVVLVTWRILSRQQQQQQQLIRCLNTCYNFLAKIRNHITTIHSRTCGLLCNFWADARCVRETCHLASQLSPDAIICSTKPVPKGEFPRRSPSPISPRSLKAPPASL
jgi:hypothetical protein